MSYEIAIKKAWNNLFEIDAKNEFCVNFLGEEYEVDLEKKKVTSLLLNKEAKDFIVILILHYLAAKLKGLPNLTREWVSFKELPTGESYYPSFRKRAIEPVIRKYGSNPQGLFNSLQRLHGGKADIADASLVLEVFDGVTAMVTLWGQDEEFQAEANMLFDKNITGIFCTEDVAVLAGLIADKI